MTGDPTGSSDAAVHKALTEILAESSGVLSDRVLRKISLGPGQGWLVNSSVVAREIHAPRFALASADGEFWLETRDALTLSGFWRKVSDEAIGVARSRQEPTDEDRGALREVGDLLLLLLRKKRDPSASVDEATRAEVMRTEEEVSARVQAMKGDSLFLFSFACALDAFPSSRIHLLLSPETAAALNGGPVVATGDGIPEDELLPAVPIRATLAVYSGDRLSLSRIRKVCRRMGFRHDLRVQSEVPNPSAHRDGHVLIQVGDRDARRFEWCRRLKKLGGSVKLCVVLDYPSRENVIQAWRSGADAILGAPVSEMELSELFGKWLPEEPHGELGFGELSGLAPDAVGEAATPQDAKPAGA